MIGSYLPHLRNLEIIDNNKLQRTNEKTGGIFSARVRKCGIKTPFKMDQLCHCWFTLIKIFPKNTCINRVSAGGNKTYLRGNVVMTNVCCGSWQRA